MNKEDMKGMGVKGIGDERGVDTFCPPPLTFSGKDLSHRQMGHARLNRGYLRTSLPFIPQRRISGRGKPVGSEC